MNFSIERKTAIVTGAANGVGLAIARHFTEQGANVIFADQDAKGLQSEFVKKPENADYFAGDLRERLSRNNLLAATISKFNRVDILVNATRQVSQSSADGADSEILDMMLEQNLKQHYNLSWLVAKKLIEQAENNSDPAEPIGAIVNISSIAAQRAVPELVEYSMSCAALDQFTRSMAVALAPKRIRVNGVAFGSVMSKSLRTKLKDSPELRKGIVDATPLGRIAEAADVAEAVQFLASDSARFVTGQVVTVDGGRSLLDRSSSAFH